MQQKNLTNVNKSSVFSSLYETTNSILLLDHISATSKVNLNTKLLKLLNYIRLTFVLVLFLLLC